MGFNVGREDADHCLHATLTFLLYSRRARPFHSPTMPLGIIEPSSAGHVPGTQTFQNRMALQTLQRLPLPSKSPNDPLNWPDARKNVILAILCATSIPAASLNPILATNTFQLVSAFHTTFTKIAMLTGYNVLALAVASLFFSATCRVWGRRHTFLFGVVLMVIGCFWAATADSYNSMLGARIIQGIGIAPFEGLIQVVVADMYFVAQRGRAYGVVAFSYLAGVTITPIITGKLTENAGRRVPFWILGGVFLFFTFVLFLFLEETAFDRTSLDCDAEGHGVTEFSSTERRGDPEKPESQFSTLDVRLEGPLLSHIGTFSLARLSPFSGRYSEHSLLKLIVRPIILLLHPVIFWGGATTGLVTAWTVMLATVVAALFATYPHFYHPSKIGYLYAGPLIGAFIALPVAGLSSDYLVKVLTRKYQVYEAEYRILLIIPFAITAAIGLFGFGYTVDLNPAIPSMFFGFVIAAVILANVASGTYVADAYQDLSVDCFISFLVVKNTLAFGLTVAGLDWLNRVGVEKMFLICGCTQLGVCVLAIPMYLFGKVIRKWSADSSFWRKVFA